jgi:hypothetical protein
MLRLRPGGQVSRLPNEFHFQRLLELTKFQNIQCGAAGLLSSRERSPAIRGLWESYRQEQSRWAADAGAAARFGRSPDKLGIEQLRQPSHTVSSTRELTSVRASVRGVSHCSEAQFLSGAYR